MDNQDLITGEAPKGLEIIKHNSMTQPDDGNGSDDVYLSNSTTLGNEAIQSCKDKEIYYEERYVPVENEIYKQDEVTDKIVIDKVSTEVTGKRTRRSNRLLVNEKKENLKTTICGKVLKQKKVTKKSSKMATNTISDEMLTLYKKFEAERYEKSMLPSFRYAQSNNANNMLQHIPYGIAKPEESYYNYNSNNNRNMLQYLDYNNLRPENLKPPMLTSSNPWLFVPKSGQNFTLNNITNTQNQIGQTSFINDRQYNTYAATDYNVKQEENPYFHSSIKSADSHKLFNMENKVFRCSCNLCTSHNMHTNVEIFPKTNNAIQGMVNNSSLSYIPSAASNNVWNTALGSFNYFPNYQPLQADYNFKRLFYSGFNTMNNTNNGYNMMARKNPMSPLNNWNSHINHLTVPYNNNNTNVVPDVSVPSEPLPSSSFYTGNTSTQFSNYYNKDLLAKANMSVDQYKERGSFNPSTIPTFENSSSASNTHGLDSESTNISLQNNITNQQYNKSNESNIMYDITNFASETNTANESEESPSYIYVKEMDKNWSSNISDI
ncbi:uncharacterized protein [Anoplolepis gracilipes]|uniref:uncharacterized protein n=1 Tax=Anoplolepis gracilipes TaxID=354296 RepID=UPI003B9FED53